MAKELGKKNSKCAQSIVAYNETACQNGCWVDPVENAAHCGISAQCMENYRHVLFNKYYPTVRQVSGI